MSVPVGRTNKLCFNAHRVYHPDTIIQTLATEGFEILEFSYIYVFDTAVCLKNIEGKIYINQNNLNQIPEYQNWGLTGLFEFRKL